MGLTPGRGDAREGGGRTEPSPAQGQPRDPQLGAGPPQPGGTRCPARVGRGGGDSAGRGGRGAGGGGGGGGAAGAAAAAAEPLTCPCSSPAMARRVAAVLLLLALGCLLGILLLCLGSGDTRGPPGFKVSGAGTGGTGHGGDGDSGHRGYLGYRRLREPRWAPRAAGCPVRERLRHPGDPQRHGKPPGLGGGVPELRGGGGRAQQRGTEPPPHPPSDCGDTRPPSPAASDLLFERGIFWTR